jgi:hypothetical protein
VQHVQQAQQRELTLAEMWLDLRTRGYAMLAQAERDGLPLAAKIGAFRELTRLTELGFRASAELRRTESGAPLHEHRDWPAHVRVLQELLHEHPQALAAVRRALAIEDEGAA